MFNGKKVIDVHGHMTTPPAFRGAIANWVSQNTGPGSHHQHWEGGQAPHRHYLEGRGSGPFGEVAHQPTHGE